MKKSKIINLEHSLEENVYNPSRPFKLGSNKYIFARVENIEKQESKIYPFVFKNGIWKRLDWKLKEIELEDPAISFIKGKLILIAVRVLEKPRDNFKAWVIRTEFYQGNDIFNLKKFAEGPLGMKDIRLVETDNKIGVFTRPQGGQAKRGRIGYLEIKSLEDVKKVDFDKGKLIDIHLKNEEWVGTNDAFYLGNGVIGVLGHLAYEDKKSNLHYSAIVFKFNINEFRAFGFKIIARRKYFPYSKIKSERTKDVIFPGGFEFKGKKVILYCGLSDAAVGTIEIVNPFK